MRTAFLAAFCVAATASTSHATLWFFSASLNGAQEVPPSGSPGIGSATATLDDVTGQVILSGSYSGLLSASTLAHIHGLAPVGTNAGILINLTHSFATSGSLS